MFSDRTRPLYDAVEPHLFASPGHSWGVRFSLLEYLGRPVCANFEFFVFPPLFAVQFRKVPGFHPISPIRSKMPWRLLASPQKKPQKYHALSCPPAGMPLFANPCLGIFTTFPVPFISWCFVQTRFGSTARSFSILFDFFFSGTIDKFSASNFGFGFFMTFFFSLVFFFGPFLLAFFSFQDCVM